MKCRLYLISLTSILSLQVHSFFEADLDKLNYFRAHPNGRIRTDSISKHICSRWTFKMFKNPKCSKIAKMPNFSKQLKWSGKIEIFQWRNFWVENRIQFANWLLADWTENRIKIFIFLALWVILTTFGNEQLISF